MGSSPTGGAYLLWSYGVMVSTQDSESCDPGSNPGRTSCFAYPDTLAEWLRRVIRNHMGFPRAGSNPVGDATFWAALPEETEGAGDRIHRMSSWPNWIRRVTTNHEIEGSSPSEDALYCNSGPMV